MLTFQDCERLMSKCRKGEKRLTGRNTILYKRDEHAYCVRYHWTDVVVIHDDGSYTLNTGGYQTVTTKARINEYSPARVSQMNWVWYIDGQPFKAGCRVDSNGNLIENLQDFLQKRDAEKNR